MKRSEINSLMRKAIGFFRENHFYLPPFAYWSPEQWKKQFQSSRMILDQNLGWDITDFGSGNFYKSGLLLFTLRNGIPSGGEGVAGKLYAEKIMVVEEDQVTPTHFHFHKMEDIINRGGGVLVIQLWQSDDRQKLSDLPVTVYKDGVKATLPAGATIELNPGESVCLPQRLYHQFWGKRGTGTVLVGEVSLVNDDHKDNYFLDEIGRFSSIEEDEEPLHLLVNDYAAMVKAKG